MENVRSRLPGRLLYRDRVPFKSRVQKLQQKIMFVHWSKTATIRGRLGGKGFNELVEVDDNIAFIFGNTGVLKYIMGQWRIIKRKRQEDLIVHELQVTLEHEWMIVINKAIRIGILVCSTPTNRARTYVTLYLHEKDIPGGIKEDIQGGIKKDIPRNKISIKTLRNKFKALADEVNAAAVPVDAAVPVEEMNVLHLKL